MIKPLVIAASMMLFAASAMAQDAVSLSSNPDGQAQHIIERLFPSVMRDSFRVRIDTAVINLNGDKMAELVGRFRHRDTCDLRGFNCRTVVLGHDGERWVKLLDRPARTIALGDKGQDDMRDVIINDTEVWTWDEGEYRPNLNKMGDVLDFVKAPETAAATLIQAFGEATARLAENSNVDVFYARYDMDNDQSNEIIAYVHNEVICGAVGNCPMIVLRRTEEGFVPIFEGYKKGEVAVLPVARSGVRDFVITSMSGMATYGWNGDAYALANTLP